MMKKNVFKLMFIVCLCVAASVVTACGGEGKNGSTTGEPDPTPLPEGDYTEADILKAYDAFNTKLFDPTRRLYYRDTNKGTAVGAIWTQAIYWDMAMNAYKKTNDEKYRTLVYDIYAGCGAYYRNYDFHDQDPKYGWFIYDDIMWWVISFARAYEIFKDPQFLAHSEAGFDRVWNGSPTVGDLGSYDKVGSGMYWRWRPENPTSIDNGKMACINYPTVIAAMTLYNTTDKVDYLNKAKEIYTWAHDNLFNTTTGAVADSRHGNGTPAWTTHVYNQATCIGAAVLLYKETGDEKYLNDAVLAADYTKNTMCVNGILPYKEGPEQGVYTAIFAQYISMLIDCGKSEYADWLRQTINTGWKNRMTTSNLTSKNYSAKITEYVISCYDASGIPALMLVCPAK